MPGTDLIVPAVAVGTIIGNAAIAWAAVRKLELRVDDHDERIRAVETDLAVAKATWGR